MASYKQAVEWIASNDDAEIGDEDRGYIVSVHLVADLWRKEPKTVARAVERHRRKNP